MGENIGAVARVMWNFGLDRLRLVAPRDGWPNPAAVAMASGAGRLLDAAATFDDLAAAAADLTFLYAATARPRELTKPVLTPRAAVAEARARIAAGERVGFVLGPERAGLETAEVARAGAIVSVPVNPAFPSLNLAQCAAILAYEWACAGEARPAARAAGRADPASVIEVERLSAHLERRLEAAGFFFPADRAAVMKLMLRNALARLGLMRTEVQTIHGILRQLARGARPGRGAGGD
ncbi:MAG: RNA methyltransferase [Rhodobacteraceae bacterium]|nr:RNA methyltransferase [Paracoccaceae bacterium]